MKRFYIILAGLFLMVLAWEAGSQSRQTIYDDRFGLRTNNPQKSLHVVGDIRFTGPLPGYSAGAPDDGSLLFVNSVGDVRTDSRIIFNTNSGALVIGNTLFYSTFIATVSEPFYFSADTFGFNTNNASTTIESFSTDADGALRLTSPHGLLLQVSTNGNVGIGTNEPKALLHFYSPLTANPKLLQFDDDAHTPRAFAGIFPGGGGFSFFNGAGTNDNARTIGWTAASTIMNAPTTVEFQVGGVAQHRLTLTQFAPVSDNAERLGTSALRYSEGNFVNLTNAGSMSVGGRFGQTNKTLAYAGTTNVFVDGTLGNVFNLTLTANTHLIFTNIQEAYSGWINLVQDGTGSRLLSYNNANVKTNATITASTAAGSVDVLFFATGLIGTNLNIILHTAFK